MKRVKHFLTNRDETGRFIVRSLKTGKTYYVEPIEKGRPPSWGDLDPATKKTTGNYGKKYRGAVAESESMITELNGFSNISTVLGSPFSEIEKRDEAYLKGARE
ncbi:MAG: hypothetical protein P8P74_11180 [Crocinitomicaceae bacterium]|nr:hypothetical protein [Crocinitomicaceae bacterium]